MRVWCASLCIWLLMAGFGWAAPAEAKRIALVIANSNYTHAAALKNPAADARLIADVLRRSGFDEVQIRSDLGKVALEAELRSFGVRSEGTDVALIYYAGHGIEAEGENYLIPTDAQLLRDRDLEVEATRMNTALAMTESARMRILILDACRNNPFAATMQRTATSRAVGRGLARVEPTGETLVVYAAKAGSTAADGDGANSPFAEALAKRMQQPGLEISLLFRTVRDDVLARTERTQEPFTYGSLSGQAFYFRPPGKAAVAIKSARPALFGSALAVETAFWDEQKKSGNVPAYRSYLKRYPNGKFVIEAHGRIRTVLQRTERPGAIGVLLSKLGEGDVEAFGLPAERGEIVQMVKPESPARLAGIRVGDVITSVNGSTITPEIDATSLISTALHNTEVPVTVWRRGEILRTKVMIVDGPSSSIVPDMGSRYRLQAEDSFPEAPFAVQPLGLTLQRLKDLAASRLSLDQNGGLFLVGDVETGGNGAALGLERGDLVMMFDGKFATTGAEVEQTVANRIAQGKNYMAIRIKKPQKDPKLVSIRIR
jgi:Caspase domain/PDZ domain